MQTDDQPTNQPINQSIKQTPVKNRLPVCGSNNPTPKWQAGMAEDCTPAQHEVVNSNYAKLLRSYQFITFEFKYWAYPSAIMAPLSLKESIDVVY